MRAHLWREVIDDIAAEEASIRNLYRGDGRPVAEVARMRRTDPRRTRAVLEAAQFLADVCEGRVSSRRLYEAMTTSDFPILFGDVIDRTVLAKYAEWPATWPAIARRVTVRDFRNAKYYPPAVGAESRLDVVPEQGEYREAELDEQATISFNVKKYGRRVTFSWEAMVNDDLQLLQDIPERLAVAARRTEQRAATELYVDASGPHASYYTAGNKNIVNTTNGAATDNPPLSIAGLQDAMKVLARMTDESGEPIFIEMVTLVVPPALEIVARNILNATQLELTQQGGIANVQRTDSSPSATGEQRLITQNWMRNNVTLVVDPYIPLTATTANGHTSWFLFANPTTSRPGLLLAFLRGHEQPQIWIKEPNARQAGGGEVDPMDGDFDTDGIVYRVRHVLGAARVDPRASVASNGSGA